MTFGPRRNYKNVRLSNRTEVSAPAAERENERELENKKRGGRQRCNRVASVRNVGTSEARKRHMFRNARARAHTLTADGRGAAHPQVSLLPGVAALLKHQRTEITVHTRVRALTHRDANTRKHTTYKQVFFFFFLF